MAAAKAAATTSSRPKNGSGGGIEVNLTLYVLVLLAIMACSLFVGLQETFPELTSESLSQSASTASDRFKIVRDAFLVSESETKKEVKDDVDVDVNVVSFDPTAAAAGEHLLVDIEGIEADFLDSESRLAQAMITTAKEAGLEMLSYHCHSLEPKGVSCVGVLLESHISFHTWPDEGVITLDLYVTTVSTNTEQQAKQKPLVPEVLEIIKQQFGVKNDDAPAPRPLNARWSHEFRGFETLATTAAQLNDGIHLAGSDLSLWVLSPLEMHTKNLIFSGWTQSNQRVDIWDVVEVTDTPSRKDIIDHGLKEGDFRLYTPELVTPNRLIFLNGQVEVSMAAETVFYESTVHPAMFAHKNPQTVAILAGPVGLGSGLIREILKHDTITSLTAWHTNAQLVEEIVPTHLSALDDCQFLVGRADQCSKDPLVSLKYYGEENFSDVISSTDDLFSQQQQDLIFILDFESILKTTTESSPLSFSQILQGLLVNGLTDEGILLIPCGNAAAIHDPRPDLGEHARREQLFLALEALPEVATILVYEEAHTGHLEPESYILVCKHVSCRQRWYARSDQVEYQIYDRLVRTTAITDKHGTTEKSLALSYFDGITQRSYQWPKKGWETVYCRREPKPWECDYIMLNQKQGFYDIDVEDSSDSDFRVETIRTKEDVVQETRVFAKDDIPKGSYIMAEDLANSLMVTDRNLEGLNNNTLLAAASASSSEDSGGGGGATIIEDLLEFFDQHGHASIMEGSEQHYVEVGGTALIRRTSDPLEGNLEPWVPRRHAPKPKFSPVYERHRMSMDVFMVARRDIAEGEEIVMFKDMWTTPTVA